MDSLLKQMNQIKKIIILNVFYRFNRLFNLWLFKKIR